MTLVLIGYWRSDASPGWPDVREFVDDGWDPEERDRVWRYVGRGSVARSYLGPSSCRMCGELVGSLELTDGIYIWPEGLAHYVGQHSVRLPALFIAHVNEMLDALDSAEVDDGWWRSVSGP